MNKNIIDGVALMADAIRKENEEKAKQENPPTPLNVSDLTAQFTGTGTPPTPETIEGANKEQETENKENKEKEGNENE